ncbi:hypothetical protein JK636_06085 [Clostridium sp. YIM B02515]|uniref:Uncharacterized protein n=1 Tax=Clostridium rhizosphaerae TaxID=2803861 RepID=A0ABS1T7L0_9CLOT|nr:hypothetical protein [Clostridium rhizosphaerae]MBL4935325.1 hypothetical protein [Clostridium rhizosphaerae]
MADKNINFDSNKKDNSLNSTSQSKFSNSNAISNKYKNVEPLPESSRPRRDGPGGEDGE